MSEHYASQFSKGEKIYEIKKFPDASYSSPFYEIGNSGN